MLAAIAQQAGLRLYIDASANRTLNAEFTNMALDQGLRRLLRASSLSYTLLYTQGPAATDILQEVRVFGETRGETPASHDRAGLERVQRAAARRSSPSPEAHAAPEPEAEPEQEAEPALVDPEQEGDATQD